jgi:cell fate (sporulation/competence/biofilm development) regulator YlbF (YheA/YmcA/DUF963 family)
MRAALDEKIKQAAEAFGKALAEAPAVAAYRRAQEESAVDAEALRLKAELEATYDDLIRRQAAGEVLTRGEIDAYYALEQRVRANPQLSSHDASLERLKDVFSEAHNLLSGRLGLSFKDLIE